METKMFYLAKDGQQTGPFAFDVLKTMTIEPETLIWFDGLEKWKKAKDLPELSTLVRKVPPPIEYVDDNHPEIKIPPIPTMSEIKKNDYQIATHGQRLLGFLITQIIPIILFFILGGTSSDLEETDGFWLDVLYAGIGSGIFNGIFYPIFAGNIGHYIVGIKVIRESDMTPVKNILFGFGREFLKGAFTFVFIPLAWLFFNDKNQNLYDKLLGTLVIKDTNR